MLILSFFYYSHTSVVKRSSSSSAEKDISTAIENINVSDSESAYFSALSQQDLTKLDNDSLLLDPTSISHERQTSLILTNEIPENFCNKKESLSLQLPIDSEIITIKNSDENEEIITTSNTKSRKPSLDTNIPIFISDVPTEFQINSIYFTKKLKRLPNVFYCILIKNDRYTKIKFKKNRKNNFETKGFASTYDRKSIVDVIKDLINIKYIVFVNCKKDVFSPLAFHENPIEELKKSVEDIFLEELIAEINEKSKVKRVFKILNLNPKYLNTTTFSTKSSTKIYMNIQDNYFENMKKEFESSEFTYEIFLTYYCMFKIENIGCFNFLFMKLFSILSHAKKIDQITDFILSEVDNTHKSDLLNFLESKKLISKQMHGILLQYHYKMIVKESLHKNVFVQFCSSFLRESSSKDLKQIKRIAQEAVNKYGKEKLDEICYLVKPIYDYLIEKSLLEEIFDEHKEIYKKFTYEFLNTLSDFSIRKKTEDKLKRCEVNHVNLKSYIVDERIAFSIKILLNKKIIN